MTTKVAAAVSAGTALWLSIGLLAVTGADTTRRIGFLPPWWLLPIFILATIAVVVASRIPVAKCLPLFLSLLIVLPWLPLPVPDVFLVVTGRAVLLVWSMIALSVIASAAAGVRPEWLRVICGPRLAPYAAAILAFTVFLVVWAFQRSPPTGDEPHYLITAQSLLRDGDVRVANNYQRADYLSYYGGVLEPHFSRPGVDGELYPGHPIGLSAMVAPAFAAGGYRGVVVWIAALTAIGTALMWKTSYLLTRDVGAAWFGWAVVTLTAPVLLYGSLVYPDPLAGLVFAGAALALTRADSMPTGRPPSGGSEGRLTAATGCAPWPIEGSLALGVGIGVLPWLHTRMALPAAILAAMVLARLSALRSKRWAHVVAFASPIVIGIGGWIAFSRVIYGTFNPAAPFTDRGLLELRRIPAGFLGLMTDQEFGLLPNAPVHLLSLGGLWPLFRRNRRLSVEWLLLVVPYALALSAWGVWWAGSCPPARFVVPVIFPLGAGAAALWATQDGRGRTVSLTMLGASVAIAAVFAFGDDGALGYNDAVGRARWLHWVSPLADLSRALPSFFRTGAFYAPTTKTIVVDLATPALVWALAILGGWAAFAAIDRRIGRTTAVRGFTAPACLALACGFATTASWKIAGGQHLTPTRSQLDLLRGRDLRWHAIGVQLVPLEAGRAADLATRLAITTSPVDAPPRGTLLFLTEVPAGGYRLRVTRTSPGRGELVLGVGRATLPIERWPVSDANDDYTFHLPVRAASLTVTGDEAALASIEHVALIPVVLGDPRADSTRGRDAARYGDLVVYALDDRVWLEGGGFWVMGDRRPDVVVSARHPVSFLDVVVHNRPVPNTVRVRSGRWYAERALKPDESWSVRVPLPEALQDVTVGFDVARGSRPADVNPASRDRRSLGCWVEVH